MIIIMSLRSQGQEGRHESPAFKSSKRWTVCKRVWTVGIFMYTSYDTTSASQVSSSMSGSLFMSFAAETSSSIENWFRHQISWLRLKFKDSDLPQTQEKVFCNLLDKVCRVQWYFAWAQQLQLPSKKKNKTQKMARLMFKCSGPLSVWKLWVCVLRQNQFQFASTSHCAVNNGSLVANIQPMMDHNYNIMTVCNKVTLPHVISCFFTLDLIFLVESIKCARKITPTCFSFGVCVCVCVCDKTLHLLL